MKNSYPTHHNSDINLFELFITIWDKKIKIAIITVIVSAILIGYNDYKPKKSNEFKNSLAIGMTKAEQFLSFIPVYDYLQININNQNVLEQFIEEFLDYEELIIVLENVEDIKEKLSQLSEQEQQQMLYNYAKLFKIQTNQNFYDEEKKDRTNNKYILEFTWEYEGKQARDILDQALKLTLKNLEKSIFLNLDNNFKIQKDKIIRKDLERIAYLSEQSLIARKLDLEESKVDFYNLSEIQASFNFNSGTTSPYYLRGYKAIDMEISVIENRKYPQLAEIEQEIDLLKKKNVRWINYNIFLLDVKLQNHSKALSPVIVILFSLLIAVFYALISNKIKSYRVPKKTK